MKKLTIVGLLIAVFSPPLAAKDSVLLDRIVAVVENEAIMQSQLDDRIDVIQRQYADRIEELPPPGQLERQVLERMVLESLQLQMAEARGIRIDELTLNEAMRDLAARNNLSLPAFRDRLVAEGINYVSFREQVRDELIISTLRQRVVDSQVQVSEQEVDEQLARQATLADSGIEYRLRHILIALPEGASPEQIQSANARAARIRERALAGENFAKLAASESDGQNSLEGGDLGWRTAARLPTLFARSVTTMEDGDTSEIIRSPSGFHLIHMVARRGGERAMVDQTHARHILIEPNALLSDAEARQRLASIKGRIAGGDDFAALARANSHDKASAVDGGDLGWISPGQMVPEFEQVMNSLEPGQMSEPFRTQFGWHVVEVTGRRQHDSTVELQRERARDAIAQRKADEEAELWLRRLRDESYVEYRLERGDQNQAAAGQG
ncbi:MAG: peptidylprolyl isomerase [Gammaproteobacteria bacterium]